MLRAGSCLVCKLPGGWDMSIEWCAGSSLVTHKPWIVALRVGWSHCTLGFGPGPLGVTIWGELPTNRSWGSERWMGSRGGECSLSLWENTCQWSKHKSLLSVADFHCLPFLIVKTNGNSTAPGKCLRCQYPLVSALILPHHTFPSSCASVWSRGVVGGGEEGRKSGSGWRQSFKALKCELSKGSRCSHFYPRHQNKIQQPELGQRKTEPTESLAWKYSWKIPLSLSSCLWSGSHLSWAR